MSNKKLLNSVQFFGEYKNYKNLLCVYEGTGGQHSGARKLIKTFKPSEFLKAWNYLNTLRSAQPYIEEVYNNDTYKYFQDGTGSGFSECIRCNKGTKVYIYISKDSIYNQTNRTPVFTDKLGA